jgi:hypothetical protein
MAVMENVLRLLSVLFKFRSDCSPLLYWFQIIVIVKSFVLSFDRLAFFAHHVNTFVVFLAASVHLSEGEALLVLSSSNIQGVINRMY